MLDNEKAEIFGAVDSGVVNFTAGVGAAVGNMISGFMPIAGAT
ncbi:hypothetical protein [Flavobacterium galactosidilyticum]|nr:hypothetical protein [Flavobacterium sp. F-340]